MKWGKSDNPDLRTGSDGLKYFCGYLTLPVLSDVLSLGFFSTSCLNLFIKDRAPPLSHDHTPVYPALVGSMWYVRVCMCVCVQVHSHHAMFGILPQVYIHATETSVLMIMYNHHSTAAHTTWILLVMQVVCVWIKYHMNIIVVRLPHLWLYSALCEAQNNYPGHSCSMMKALFFLCFVFLSATATYRCSHDDIELSRKVTNLMLQNYLFILIIIQIDRVHLKDSLKATKNVGGDEGFNQEFRLFVHYNFTVHNGR